MVVLRAGMCPGLDEDLVRDLRSADVKTGVLPGSSFFGKPEQQ